MRRLAALTAYDTQKLKQLALLGVTEGEETSHKASIPGTLTLYLDFVNLFLLLLCILWAAAVRAPPSVELR